MRHTSAVLLPLLLATVGCKKAPAEAPTELSDLAGFLFERMWDEPEDSADLELGVENLVLWLEDHSEETAEGYTVRELDESVIEAVNPNRESGLGPVGGASVSGEIKHRVKPIASALVLDEQEDIFENYKSHERTYFGEPKDFMKFDPDRLTTDNEVETKLSIFGTLQTFSRAQFRWVELESGQRVFLHRTWLLRPASVSAVTVNEQLYFGITIPWDGHALRLGTTWAQAELTGGVGEDAAINMIIDSMAAEAGILDEYLD